MILEILDETKLLPLLEALLLAAGKPLREEDLLALFSEEERPSKVVLRQALKDLQESCESRGIRLVEIASGFQFQINPEWAPWVSKLWEEKAPRYSRALLETLALIAYRQPITRGEIEEIRGVSISQSIFKTLLEDREWIRVVGHREVPGKPALYATTKHFLDYFGLKTLEELPSLPDIMNLENASEMQDEKVEKFIQMALIDNAGEALTSEEESDEALVGDNDALVENLDALQVKTENAFSFTAGNEEDERVGSNESDAFAEDEDENEENDSHASYSFEDVDDEENIDLDDNEVEDEIEEDALEAEEIELLDFEEEFEEELEDETELATELEAETETEK